MTDNQQRAAEVLGFRDQLAEMLPHRPWCPVYRLAQCICLPERHTDVDELLPVVDRIADKRAADALRQAAQWLTGTGGAGDPLAPDETSEGLSWRRDVRTPNDACDWLEQSLLDRADAITGRTT